jgi:hypothetical protein
MLHKSLNNASSAIFLGLPVGVGMFRAEKEGFCCSVSRRFQHAHEVDRRLIDGRPAL